MPHGDTLLMPGDRVLVFAAPSARADEVAAWLAGEASVPSQSAKRRRTALSTSETAP